LNDLEKKSFYSFLALYLGSSLFFILLSGYWYYSAQKNSLESNTYYKMEHLADKISSLIINAHMHQEALALPEAPKNYEYMLIPTKDTQVYKEKYFEENSHKVLISSSPRQHLEIEYVVVKTDEYHKSLKKLKNNVLVIMLVVFFLIVVISYALSKLFMRPIRQKVIQIENFVQDISHELNTPITALKMSSQRALQKGVYDEKILTNISISTKQLYTIYQSLTYLNFNTQTLKAKQIDIQPILVQTIEYYEELLNAKNIHINTDIKDANLIILEDKASLLFSNLISNAIKYSMPDTRITLILKEGFFSIQDEGVGIPKEKLEDIFELYERGSSVAGGFGVGLSIVKQICDEFSIAIEVKSELDVGSCFELRWKDFKSTDF